MLSLLIEPCHEKAAFQASKVLRSIDPGACKIVALYIDSIKPSLLFSTKIL